MSRCKLCNLEKPLIKTSHIIPDWMYEHLYTQKHKLYKFAPADYVAGNRRIQMPSSGEYEGDLLCKRCDNVVIGPYEDYARKAFKGGTLPVEESPTSNSFVSPGGMEYTEIRNINYAKFKLFLLSILWRASVSSRDFFKSISLGPHGERIRQMILNGDPGSIDDYPIVVLTYLTDPSSHKDMVAEPGRLKDNQGTRYIFIIAGFAYVFHVSKHDIPSFVLKHTIKPSNEMTVLHIPKGKGEGLLMNYFGVSV